MYAIYNEREVLDHSTRLFDLFMTFSKLVLNFIISNLYSLFSQRSLKKVLSFRKFDISLALKIVFKEKDSSSYREISPCVT